MIQVSYPGVYIQELPTHAKTISGVSTSPIDALAWHGDPAAAAHAPPAPEWSAGGQHDPGISLLQTFAWLGQGLPYRTSDSG